MSGALPAGGVATSITAWDTNGNVVLESGSAAPLLLYSYETTIIGGIDLQSRFISGFPTLYEFSIGSSNAIVTSLTTSADCTRPQRYLPLAQLVAYSWFNLLQSNGQCCFEAGAHIGYGVRKRLEKSINPSTTDLM